MTMLCDWCQYNWLNGLTFKSKCLKKASHDKRWHEKCRHFLPTFEVQNEIHPRNYKEFAKFYSKKVADYILSKIKK